MVPKFIPTTLAAISPTLDLEEAVNRAAGPGPHDYSLFKRWSDDTLTFKINGEMMSLEEAAPHIEARAALYRTAAKEILEALQAAELKAFVMKAADESIWQIPRFYFYQKKAHQLALTPFGEWQPESGEDPSMYGQPVLLSEAQFAGWLSDREIAAANSDRQRQQISGRPPAASTHPNLSPDRAATRSTGMLNFPPMSVSRADGYETMSFYELQNRLAAKGMHERIASALSSGGLTAYVQLDGDDRFFRVPIAHWCRPSPFMEGEPGEVLFCWGSSDVPAQFHDRPLLFLLSNVEGWEASETGESHPVEKTDRTGLPGRPSSKHIIADLFASRCTNGEVDTSGLASEVKELLSLFDADPSNKGLARPSQGTVENQIRRGYNAFKAEHPG